MKLLNILLLSAIVAMVGCVSKSSKTAEDAEANANDTISIVTRKFANNPKKVEYEIPVITKSGKRHGVQKRYYAAGSLYSLTPYEFNIRQGVKKTFHPAYKGQTPVVWKEEPYVNGKRDGICKRYYKDGKLWAEYPYKKGLIGIGLVEYTNVGKVRKQPTIVLTKSTDGGFLKVKARMSNKTKQVEFFNGFLVEDKYMPEGMKKIQTKSGVGTMLIPTTNIPNFVTVVAKVKTRDRHTLILKKTLKLK
ncbi:hypothetical protein EYV94_11065 [Puteibacter caeruleilacunae]|nr:hypothetical protein EYV94_11065 [Puteibacter caeruleilacunae]